MNNRETITTPGQLAALPAGTILVGEGIKTPGFYDLIAVERYGITDSYGTWAADGLEYYPFTGHGGELRIIEMGRNADQ